MIDSTLVYTDSTPLLTRAALTGDVTASAGSNTTTIATGSGGGGGTMWGGQPRASGRATLGTTPGRGGQAYGAGGSGAVSLNSTGGSAGGDGAAGVIIIKEYCQ